MHYTKLTAIEQRTMHTAGFCHITPDGVIQCDLCRHYCRIRTGTTGICRVRKNVDGKLIALSYGRAILQGSMAVEKNHLFHFMPSSSSWSFGTPGCNFRCSNCTNWKISQMSPDNESTPFITPEKITESALHAGCHSICCTFTEPTIYAEYALDVMRLSRQAGLRCIWVSNGYLSENCLEAILPWLDAITIDLKSMDDSFYRRVCAARLAPLLDSLRQIRKSGIHLEISTQLIPGQSDNPLMLERLAGFIVNNLGPEVPWHIIPLFPGISWKMHETAATPAAVIETARKIGIAAGLYHIYTENADNDTLCHTCGTKLVTRKRTFSGYRIERFDSGGCCPSCKAPSPIIR